MGICGGIVAHMAHVADACGAVKRSNFCDQRVFARFKLGIGQNFVVMQCAPRLRASSADVHEFLCQMGQIHDNMVRGCKGHANVAGIPAMQFGVRGILRG